jgi:endoribonuclease LACTB2
VTTSIVPAGRFVEVAPDIRVLAVRTPTLLPATHTNLLVVGRANAIVIEPATPYEDEQARALFAIDALRAEGIAPTELLLTHHHPDHAGGAGRFAAALGLPVRGHEETLARIDPSIPRGAPIADGETVGAVRAIHTPGHAPGHLAYLHDATGFVVAGDMVAGIGTILVEPSEGDMAVYLASLRKLDALAPTALVPAHGDVLGREVLLRYVAHRLAREAKVLAALEAHGGPTDAASLVPVAYDDAPPTVWPIASLSTEAHLVKLEREGRATRDERGWRPMRS